MWSTNNHGSYYVNMPSCYSNNRLKGLFQKPRSTVYLKWNNPLSSWEASYNAIFNTGEYNFNTATHLLLPTALTNYYPPLSRFSLRLAASSICPSSRRWWTTVSYVLSPVKEILLSRSSFSRASESSSVNGVPANTTSNVDKADNAKHQMNTYCY